MTKIVSPHSQWNTAFEEACTAYADALSSANEIGELVLADALFNKARAEYDHNTKNQTLFAGALGDKVRRACLLADGATRNTRTGLEKALRQGNITVDAHVEAKIGGAEFDALSQHSQRAISVARFSAKCFHYIASCC